jgi:hypothetical protein
MAVGVSLHGGLASPPRCFPSAPLSVPSGTVGAAYRDARRAALRARLTLTPRLFVILFRASKQRVCGRSHRYSLPTCGCVACRSGNLEKRRGRRDPRRPLALSDDPDVGAHGVLSRDPQSGSVRLRTGSSPVSAAETAPSHWLRTRGSGFEASAAREISCCACTLGRCWVLRCVSPTGCPRWCPLRSPAHFPFCPRLSALPAKSLRPSYPPFGSCGTEGPRSNRETPPTVVLPSRPERVEAPIKRDRRRSAKTPHCRMRSSGGLSVPWRPPPRGGHELNGVQPGASITLDTSLRPFGATS